MLSVAHDYVAELSEMPPLPVFLAPANSQPSRVLPEV
jgi:hypothetical protein